MLRKLPVFLLPLVLLYPTMSHAGLFGPSNYDECITESMKGVSSDVAARAIIESCRNLFPESGKEAAPEDAPAAEPARVEESAVPAAPAAIEPAAPAPATPAAQAEPVIEPASLDATNARDLTAGELARLGSRAKVFGSTYRVTIDNGNPNLTLTEVTIAVWDDMTKASSLQEFSEPVRIAPGASAEVKYTVYYKGDDSGWNWDVVSARGVE